MLLFIRILTSYLIFIPSLLQSQDPQRIVDEVQKKYSSFQSFSANFTQEIQSSAFEEKQIVKGKLLFAKENNYRLDYKNHLIVSDGKTIYNYSKNLKRVIITNFEENFFSPQNLLVYIPKESKLEFKGEEFSGKEILKIISFITSKINSQYKSFKIWVDSDSFIKKIETEDWAQNKYTITIHTFIPNLKIDPEQFRFKIPKGVKVVDFR